MGASGAAAFMKEKQREREISMCVTWGRLS